MTKLSICVAIILFACSAVAQTKSADITSNAVLAYANGNDSYLQFAKDYKPESNYIVFKFWNAKESFTEKEQNEIASLKRQLSAANIQLVAFPWKTEEDLKAVLGKYNVAVKVSGDNRINLKGQNYNMNTTAGNATLVLQNNTPVSLCSGKDCDARLKTFFKTAWAD